MLNLVKHLVFVYNLIIFSYLVQSRIRFSLLQSLSRYWFTWWDITDAEIKLVPTDVMLINWSLVQLTYWPLLHHLCDNQWTRPPFWGVSPDLYISSECWLCPQFPCVVGTRNRHHQTLFGDERLTVTVCCSQTPYPNTTFNNAVTAPWTTNVLFTFHHIGERTVMRSMPFTIWRKKPISVVVNTIF